MDIAIGGEFKGAAIRQGQRPFLTARQIGFHRGSVFAVMRGAGFNRPADIQNHKTPLLIF